MRELGYARFEPRARLTPRRLRSYLAHQKDFSYEHPSAGVVIDLHWRLFRNPFLPSNAGIDQVGGLLEREGKRLGWRREEERREEERCAEPHWQVFR